ncbi:MAG TPA: spore protease YyaC [Thermoanaerobacter sp.]|nr:spore protease YyaC [Thermoanaerobacter sp.]
MIKIEEMLFNLIAQKINGKDKIVILCIGTDKVIFDSYGPFVGYLLKNVYRLQDKENVVIMGDLKESIHALNLAKKLEEIDKDRSLIIAIDAAVTYSKGQHKEIIIGEGPIEPGNAAGKKLPRVGDVNIKGLIFNGYIFGEEEISIRIGDIADMAERTAEYINNAVQKYLEIESHILKTARFQKKTVSI